MQTHLQNPAGFIHGMRGIGAQVDHDLIDLGWVGHDQTFGIEILPDLYVRGDD